MAFHSQLRWCREKVEVAHRKPKRRRCRAATGDTSRLRVNTRASKRERWTVDMGGKPPYWFSTVDVDGYLYDSTGWVNTVPKEPARGITTIIDQGLWKPLIDRFQHRFMVRVVSRWGAGVQYPVQVWHGFRVWFWSLKKDRTGTFHSVKHKPWAYLLSSAIYVWVYL